MTEYLEVLYKDSNLVAPIKSINKLVYYEENSFITASRDSSIKLWNNNDDTNTVGSKILDIINNKEINLSDNITSDNNLPNINEKHNLTETSISYNKNEKFQEVFSNNNNLPVLSEKNNIDKKKSKFFANYLNL
jgi:hypothetical protein